MSVPAEQIGSWPKQRPVLSEQQHAIMKDWYAHWLTVGMSRYGRVVRFNHTYAAQSAAAGARTLEIGAGTGEHLCYETHARQEYYALELRPELADILRSRFPEVRIILGDCQQRIDVPDGFFDRVLAVHLLEHLNDLPRALDEVARVLRPGGLFSVVIPCEGGTLYRIGRQFSSKRHFEKRYSMSYEWMISYEHVNRADEILKELQSRFVVQSSAYYPFRVPAVHLNLVIGLTLTRKPRI